MIVIEVNGRLGNQMFQYAFGMRLARQWNTSFILVDPRGKKIQLEEFFRLNLKYRVLALLRDWRILRFSGNQKIDLFDDDRCFEFLGRLELGREAPRAATLRGFFQSHRYFQPVEDAVRREFRFRSRYLQKEPMARADVVFHVRRGDYQRAGGGATGGTDVRLPWSYYRQAAALLPVSEGALVVCETIDAEIEEAFTEAQGFRLSTGSMVQDFMTLARARSLVISNSTFAWWAAYLGQATSVIAPLYWWGFRTEREVPRGIHYPGYRWVEV